ncbi:hypothetical protein PRZ48_000122 [Zasmidium cellare]|uniref:Heterokaryon incompatibility domain-containing protein n=1 Tax=Zasmidium cellare TaxID=395010 RepID=A0ABR0EY02_ZASCE|nr:hypothetical protein PRZ48_000122 [Zasmidium cellare]
MRFLELDEHDELRLTRDMQGSLPPYAILSHVWETRDSEVLSKDIMNGTAARKSGSVELSQAINSMFRWYQQATKCYAYLYDVSTYDWQSKLHQARWFTRGWTLQELIAPESVEFYSCEWIRQGDKRSLLKELHSITGIPVPALLGAPLNMFSTDQRMAWIANRTTTRKEDMAYSLLGIFEVSMQPIYGEGGTRAWIRLHREIQETVRRQSRTNATGMRLLVAGSNPLRLETVPNNKDLQYAILSHTWGEDEISFDDIRIGAFEHRKSYPKLRKCCDLAAKHGFDYVWVDTCCIDKSSSAELEEAICSMYSWYKRANVCYVYLEDFEHGGREQELIAPSYVEFYDFYWVEVGTKQSLCDSIAMITKIDPVVLRGGDPLKRTVAERMSWAATRSTTRVEDTAYSLMGLFNVFMPMLYGEGHRAFQRLQEEFLKQTEDDTIFSWEAKPQDTADRGIFALSPAEFSNFRSRQIVSRFDHSAHQHHRLAPATLTSRGLIITLPILQDDQDSDAIFAWVSCSSPRVYDSSNELLAICIRLREVQSPPRVFARISSHTLEELRVVDPLRFEQKTVCVLPSTVGRSDLEAPSAGVIIVHPMKKTNGFETDPNLQFVTQNVQWSPQDRSLTYWGKRSTSSLAEFSYEALQGWIVVAGLSDGVPWCSLSRSHEEALGHSSATESTQSALGAPKFPTLSTQLTDRAQRMVSGHLCATAAIRVMRSTDLHTRRFGLFVEIQNMAEREDENTVESRDENTVEYADEDMMDCEDY